MSLTIEELFKKMRFSNKSIDCKRNDWTTYYFTEHTVVESKITFQDWYERTKQSRYYMQLNGLEYMFNSHAYLISI